MKNNPLLSSADLPKFNEIKPEHAFAAVTQVIEESKRKVESLLTQDQFTWDNLMAPLEEDSDRFSKVWSPISHLNNVNNTQEWRDAYNSCLPPFIEYSTWMGQNKALYEAILSISTSKEFEDLNQAQQKVITDELRDFRLSGVALEGEEKERYAEIVAKLNKLTTKFEENILDATHAWTFHSTDKQELSGIPEHDLALAKEVAEEKGLEGRVFTLDMPSYLAVAKYADNAKLRYEMYRAYSTRASEEGPNAGEFDNSEVMVQILQLRQSLASLLGFANYAEYSLATKMANKTEQVFDFLNDLAARSKLTAERDYQQLQQFAAEEYQQDELNPWDIAYYSEKLQQKEYALSQEQLRPYFPIDKVFHGVFAIIEKLYGMQVNEVKSIETWHESVRFFEITDESGEVRGQFYADLYARAKKRGGAWHDEYSSRRLRSDQTVQIPVSYIVCNFNKPVAGGQALLTHDDVVTLFHELGHGLHHMLTKVDYLSISGTNGVAWDAVELPSQFMENFCWQQQTIPLFSEHYKTGEPLPEELFNSMLAAKNFQSGLMMVRQLEFGLFDFHLHCQAIHSPEDVQTVLDEVRKSVTVVPIPSFNRFQHSFSHIFAGGYSAGYYSYKWAEVLSSDAFSRFEEEGILNRDTGKEFLSAVLEKGGSVEPLELFVSFRGREPEVDALLNHNGIVA